MSSPLRGRRRIFVVYPVALQCGVRHRQASCLVAAPRLTASSATDLIRTKEPTISDHRVLQVLPGVALTGGIAALAIFVGERTPALVSVVLLALLAGLVIANARPLPVMLTPGVDFAARRILRVGVALLGARLTLADVADIGGPSILAVVVTMATAFATVAMAGRMAGVSPQLGILLGTGTAVCGNSAIAAASPIIDADEREVSYAVATITIFGTIALVLFPIIGRAVGLSDQEFGVWAGLAINDTSQVVAAGSAYSEQALEHATVVKLVRNALMGPILVALTIWMGRRRWPDGRAGAGAPTDAGAAGSRAQGPTVSVGTGLWRTVRSAVPAFVVAFIVLAAMRSAGLIRPEVADVLGSVSAVAITVAIAGVGLKTRIAELATVGLRPVLVGLAASTALAIVALPLARLIVG